MWIICLFDTRGNATGNATDKMTHRFPAHSAGAQTWGNSAVKDSGRVTEWSLLPSRRTVVWHLCSEAPHPEIWSNQRDLFPVCLIKWPLCAIIVCVRSVAGQLTREGLMPMLSAAWKARVRFRTWRKTNHWMLRDSLTMCDTQRFKLQQQTHKYI